MANFVFTNQLDSIDLTSLAAEDIRAILLDASSTVASEEDADFINDFTTLGEVVGTGYSRQALTGETRTVVEASDLIQYSADNLGASWGAIDVGNVAALLLYKHVTDDTDSIPWIHIDNAFDVIAAAPASASDTIIYVDPLREDIPVASDLNFPSAVTATLSAAASAGDRSISVDALSGAIALAAAATRQTQFPIPTNGGPLTIALGTFLETLNA